MLAFRGCKWNINNHSHGHTGCFSKVCMPKINIKIGQNKRIEKTVFFRPLGNVHKDKSRSHITRNIE